MKTLSVLLTRGLRPRPAGALRQRRERPLWVLCAARPAGTYAASTYSPTRLGGVATSSAPAPYKEVLSYTSALNDAEVSPAKRWHSRSGCISLVLHCLHLGVSVCTLWNGETVVESRELLSIASSRVVGSVCCNGKRTPLRACGVRSSVERRATRHDYVTRGGARRRRRGQVGRWFRISSASRTSAARVFNVERPSQGTRTFLALPELEAATSHLLHFRASLSVRCVAPFVDGRWVGGVFLPLDDFGWEP